MRRATTPCACGCKRRVEPPLVLRGRPSVYWRASCRNRAYRKRVKARRSVSVEWYTPLDVFEEALAIMGVDAFDLDPCASPRSPIWSRVTTRYTRDDDGLALPWSGSVWVNPPYGREIADWIAKAISEVRSGRVSAICILVPVKADAAWFHGALAAGFALTLRQGRIKFLEPQPDGTLACRGAGRFASAWLTFRPASDGTKGTGLVVAS